jgi:tetratricopeptide (TPR) repeat protein
LALAIALPATTVGCKSTTKPISQQQQSFTDKVSSSVKSGTSKMVALVKPKTTPAKDDPMGPPSGKPGPAVFVAAAQMHESSGNSGEAEANYRKALDIDPNDVTALVGYARLEDRQGNFEAATRFYQRAIKKHPKDASVRNDLGLCYHRRAMLPEATRELKRAVELDGDNKLYRNNLAAAYVDQGKNKEALVHLTAAHGKSVAHYNLGYLLAQKQDNKAALEQFQLAAKADGNLLAAQEWIARLSGPESMYASHAGGSSLPTGMTLPPANAAYVAQRPEVQQGQPVQYAPRGATPPAIPTHTQPQPGGALAMPPMPR